MTGFSRDIEKVIAGRVHRAAFPSAKKSMAINGYSKTTEYENRQNGHPVLRQLREYIRNAQPWVVEVHMTVLREQNSVDEWPEPYLSKRYRELPGEILTAMGETMRLAGTPGIPAADRVMANQTLMRLIAEQTAVLKRIAREQIPESRLLGAR